MLHDVFAMSALSTCATRKKTVDLKYFSVLLNIHNKKKHTCISQENTGKIWPITQKKEIPTDNMLLYSCHMSLMQSDKLKEGHGPLLKSSHYGE